MPASAASRSAGSSGMLPSSGTPSASARPGRRPSRRSPGRCRRGTTCSRRRRGAACRPSRPSGGAHGDLLGRGLRRRHDHDLGARQQLAERDGDVAGAGRHVDDERVELAPVDVGEELLERAVQHRPAPHHRRVVVEEEADRHQLQVAAHRRDDHRVDDDRPLLDAEHVRDRVSVDVRVENADPLAARRKRRGEVRGQRRLADAAFARGDRETRVVGVERDRLLRRPPRSRDESAAFSSGLMTSKRSSTEVTPSTHRRALHLILERERSGSRRQ